MSSPDDWVVVTNPDDELLRKKRLDEAKLDFLLQLDPKINDEIEQIYQSLQEEDERIRQKHDYEVYVPSRSKIEAMKQWLNKKTQEKQEEIKRHNQWKKKAQKALRLKSKKTPQRHKKTSKRIPLRRTPLRRTLRSRRKPISPIKRWKKEYKRKSRIIPPGHSSIVKSQRNPVKSRKRRRSSLSSTSTLKEGGKRKIKRKKNKRPRRKRRK